MEKTIKNAVMEAIEFYVNYERRSTKILSEKTLELLAANGIHFCEDKVLKDGIEVATIERRYLRIYKELKPKVTWLK